MREPDPNPQLPQQPPFPPPAGSYPPPGQWAPVLRVYQTGPRELIFGGVTAVLCVFLTNSILYGGFYLGFAIAMGCLIAASAGYLLLSGRRPGWYAGALLVLSLVISAGFARSDDGFVKFVMLCFLGVSVNLGLCLTGGQNRRDPGSIRSLLDAPRAGIILGWGEGGPALRGLRDCLRRTGTAGQRSRAVLLGLVLAVPPVALTAFLLMRADAAFEALLDLLPEVELSEPVICLLLGLPTALVLYIRGVALTKKEPPQPARATARGIDPVTVNTLLAAVALVYVAYLISQLAYLSGGLRGSLPQGYTMAEYARRGFFELAWLCAINLSCIWFAVGLVRKDPKAPLLTRLLCLFVGLVTVFLAVTASSKLLMYIGSYGLTRLRLLTQVCIVFLGLTSLVVCVWLFLPRLPYMKLVVLLALTLGAATMWADVDSQVARYNVTAYRSGQLKTVDVYYLSGLSSGAIPWLQALTQDGDSAVARQARDVLQERELPLIEDLRDWNYADSVAGRE